MEIPRRCGGGHGKEKNKMKMKTAEHEFRPIYFGAGRAYDAWDRPSSFWRGSVRYAWDPYKKVFHIWAYQTLGTGTAENSYVSEFYADSVSDTLTYFRELQKHYKEVYGA